ncbi:MAG TPA: winged helix-turn-helix domain-containing protein [Streptosporangiaceae bacterium]|jgi:DNA-binding transcriptional ArsR family regulator|nr:winged helix-turn-helix domain-containing protein [Streptosporangiaceae bacterium]
MTAAQLAGVAGLLADRSRAAICLALLDGRAWTVGELARHAGVAPSTASQHVAKLAGGGLLSGVQQGRHHYVRLADPATAELIEDLAEFAAPGPPTPLERGRSLRAVRASEAMARARTCYDHFAGRLGVRITDALTDARLLDQAGGFALTPAGVDWLDAAIGVDVAALRAGRRPLVRSCLDWTERRPHLGGAVGAALCGRFLAEGWVSRVSGSRAIRVTAEGALAMGRLEGIDLRDVA